MANEGNDQPSAETLAEARNEKRAASGPSAATILVVEDSAPLRQLVEKILHTEGYSVVTAGTAADGLHQAVTQNPDLVLLDLTLPDLDGVEVLRSLRSAADTPVIVVSGRGELSDRVAGLIAGADDYIVKPFAPADLAARVGAVLRRTRPSVSSTIVVGPLEIDLAARRATVHARPLDLTRKEFDLLAALGGHVGRAFSREQLLREVWRSTSDWQDIGTVTEHIRRLRAKVAEAGGDDLIETLRGVGYRLVAPDQRDRIAPSGAATPPT